jgi:acyl carrier protein
MNRNDKTMIKERIIDILDRLFSDAGVDKDILEYVDLVDDLGMDSINFISLIIELESEFDILIPDDWLAMVKFQNYSLIYEAVETLLDEKEKVNDNG